MIFKSSFSHVWFLGRSFPSSIWSDRKRIVHKMGTNPKGSCFIHGQPVKSLTILWDSYTLANAWGNWLLGHASPSVASRGAGDSACLVDIMSDLFCSPRLSCYVLISSLRCFSTIPAWSFYSAKGTIQGHRLMHNRLCLTVTVKKKKSLFI